METIKHEPRTNRDGDPCPSWCVTDHAEYGFHASDRASGYAPEFDRWTVRAVRGRASWRQHVEVASAGVVDVPLDSAADLADIIEQLAAATPDQHRELADAIRQAAAVIEDGAR